MSRGPLEAYTVLDNGRSYTHNIQKMDSEKCNIDAKSFCTQTAQIYFFMPSFLPNQVGKLGHKSRENIG
jgi:hypothetical protein